MLYQDRFTSGYQEPFADLSQDYTLTGFNESNGKTFLDFHRKRDTGDKRDIEIKVNYTMVLRKSRIANMAVELIDFRANARGAGIF